MRPFASILLAGCLTAGFSLNATVAQADERVVAAEPEVIAKGKIEKEGEGEAPAAGAEKKAAAPEKKAEKK